MKTVIYTAIFGDIRDSLQPPQNQPPCVECVAFVDDASAGEKNGWRLEPTKWPRPNSRRMARQHKCLPHVLFPDADFSLWVDGCLQPLTNIEDMICKYLEEHDLCFFKHRERSCVYQEAEACVKLKKDVPALIRSQADMYREQSYPYHNGLAETTACLRRHNTQMADLNNAWWEEIRNGSQRDQLSIDYTCWRLGHAYNHFAGTRIKSPHFKWRAHR